MTEKKNLQTKFIWWAIGLGALSIVLRLLPHAPNIVPIAALALFAGVYLPKKWGMIVPIAAMLISDFFIGFYEVSVMAIVYGSFLLMVGIGYLVRKKKNFTTVTLGVLGGSLFFFLSTNFAVWAFGSWYPHTIEGLISSYALALPFFRNSLLGNLVYTGAFFGAYALAPYAVYKLKAVLGKKKDLALEI